MSQRSGSTFHPGAGHLPEVRDGLALDYVTVRRHTARGRRLQSAAFAAGVRAAGSVLAAGVASALRSWRRWRDHRRTVAELERLDDHILRDIGIARAQIPYVAEGLLGPLGTHPRRPVKVDTRHPAEAGAPPAANDSPPRRAA